MVARHRRLAGIPGQIALGALSDRIGREMVWSLSCAASRSATPRCCCSPPRRSQPLLWLMVLSQGLLGYAFTSAIMGRSWRRSSKARTSARSSAAHGVADRRRRAGPLVTGLLYDWTGNYRIAFALGIALSVVCAVALWLAAPRKVRVVAGSL